MNRAIWSGVISFGLVSVPVRLFTATDPHEVSFHQFEKGTSDRIRYKRVNERTDDEVDYSDIVKGADIGGGNYVMLEQDELDSVAPGRSRSLEIQRFVDLDEIDPIYYQKTYYLAPPDEDTAKTYALLRDAMTRTNPGRRGRGREATARAHGVSSSSGTVSGGCTTTCGSRSTACSSAGRAEGSDARPGREAGRISRGGPSARVLRLRGRHPGR